MPLSFHLKKVEQYGKEKRVNEGLKSFKLRPTFFDHFLGRTHGRATEQEWKDVIRLCREKIRKARELEFNLTTIAKIKKHFSK